MKILNLTQHPASEDQISVGVYDLEGEDLAKMKQLLTFKSLPSQQEIDKRAWGLARLTKKVEYAMVGGAPYLMGPLQRVLKQNNTTALFAYSERVSVEDPSTGIKTSVFKHLGFVSS